MDYLDTQNQLLVMIKAVLICNTAGKIRLFNCYEKTLSALLKQDIFRKLFSLVSVRSGEMCNIIHDYQDWPTPDTRVIYRRYAMLCFIFVMDSAESELGILDIIQVFVEVLDRIFENVCELDLIFYSDIVQRTLMEMIVGGMIIETNKEEIFHSLMISLNLEGKSTYFSRNRIR